MFEVVTRGIRTDKDKRLGEGQDNVKYVQNQGRKNEEINMKQWWLFLAWQIRGPNCEWIESEISNRRMWLLTEHCNPNFYGHKCCSSDLNASNSYLLFNCGWGGMLRYFIARSRKPTRTIQLTTPNTTISILFQYFLSNTKIQQ